MGALIDEVKKSRGLPPPVVARAIRESAGVTQQRLADELHVHWTTVARWERGMRAPRGNRRLAYADLLDQLRDTVTR